MATPEHIQGQLRKVAEEVRSPKVLFTRLGLIVLARVMKKTPVRKINGGNLRRSESYEATSRYAKVRANTDYARYVDEGTRYMEGRHYMQQGLDDAQTEIKRELQSFGIKTLDQVGK